MKLSDIVNNVRTFFTGDREMNRDLSNREVYRITEFELWNIGDEVLLSDFYKENAGYGASTIDPKYSYFYKNAKDDIRIVHSGLPNLISSSMARILLSSGVKFKAYDGDNVDEQDTELLNDIYKDNKIKKLLKRSVIAKSWGGKIAWKLSVDKELSQYPIIEKYDAEEFECEWERDRLQKIIFFQHYKVDNEQFILHEEYGKGYISYRLYIKRNKGIEPVDLGYIEATSHLEDITFNEPIILAGVLDGRSDYDGLISEFDALDEAWSQWLDEIRTARTNTYIPEVLASDRQFDRFRTRYQVISSDITENGENKITHIQPDIRSEEYKNTIMNLVSNILVSVGLSPFSIGIDDMIGANASGESLVQRESSTLRTRKDAIEEWQEFLDEMSEKALYVYYRFIKGVAKTKYDYEVEVKFGEYLKPNKEDIAEFNKGLVEAGIIDTEKALNDIYGDELDEEEKTRILANTGMLTLPNE